MLDTAAVLTEEGVAYAVIGAMAASVHGVVRASVDADAVLAANAAELRRLEKKFAAAAFRTQLREGGPEDPVPAVLALGDSHGNRVDLLAALRGLDPEAFSRAITVPFQGESLRVIGREDFIAMKVFAGGPTDMTDAQSAIHLAGEALDLPQLRRLTQRYGRSTRERLEEMLRQMTGGSRGTP